MKDSGKKIIILAREEAVKHQNDYLDTQHIVLAILRERDGAGLGLLRQMGLSPKKIRSEIEKNLLSSASTITSGDIPFTPRVKKVIEYAIEGAKLLAHNYIGSEHLVLGLITEQEGIGGQVLRTLGAKLHLAYQLIGLDERLLGHLKESDLS